MDTPNILIQEGRDENAKDDRSGALERNNLILVIVGTLVSVYFQDRALTLSFLAGGLLNVLNFRLLRMIVRNLTGSKGISRGKLVAQVVVKFLGGLGALAVIMLIFHPQPVPFLVGLSTIVATIVLEGFIGIFRKE